MESSYFINLIILFTLNVVFFFVGLCLNSLVIVCFYRSTQLLKKTCNFMIMVLSCCDLLVVLYNHPLEALTAILWLCGKFNVRPYWAHVSARVGNNFTGFSLLALLVLSFDRYLATSYPVFHRLSMTKQKLITIFGILIIFQLCLASLLSTPVLVISDFLRLYHVGLVIFIILYFPPMLFMNCKLFVVAEKFRRRKEKSPDLIKKSFSLKKLSSCLLAVVCFVVLTIPVFVYIGLRITSKEEEFTWDDVNLASLWSRTISSMNSTFNCLIFYWKNKILRSEGMKVIKA